MKLFEIKGYKINICTDIYEWGREFYNIPNNAELDNKEELENECMGFSCPDENEIWLFLPNKYDKTDLLATIAHEIGDPMKSPSKSPEKKAEHYENYYMVVTEIANKILM